MPVFLVHMWEEKERISNRPCTYTHACLRMATKNIAIREEVYRKLVEAKGETESFSDTIERLLERKNSILAFSGAFKADDKELKFIEEEAKKLRKSATLRGLSL